MLITFSGLDGSGKSTLIECLRESLEKENKQVAVFHMYYDVGVLACVRSVLKWIGRNKEMLSAPKTEGGHPPIKQSQNERHKTIVSRMRYAVGWNKSLRLFIYPCDLVIFLCYRLYIEKVKKQILIMDRYFYDTLVDVAEGRRWYGVRLLSRLTPTPSVSVLVDISPDEAYARKGEHSVAYLSRRRLSYQKLFPMGRNAHILAGGDDIDTTRCTLEKIVLEKMTA